MSVRRFLNYRTITIVLLALILSAVAYGFAAANTVPTSYAGEGDGTISGYTASSIHYTLDSNYPSKITAVSFTLDQAPATLKVGLSDGSTTTWADSCTTATITPSCSFTTGGGVSTYDAVSLVVVAAD